MRIRRKIACTFLGMSLPIALVCSLAVNRQRAAAMVAVTKEAENVARVLGLLISNPAMLPASVQEIVSGLHRLQLRDVVLVNTQETIIADADPKDVAKTYDWDRGDEVGLTMKDRRVRTFIEKGADHPEGINQIVVPVESDSGMVVGGVILEYTPLYNELMHLTMVTIREVALIGFAGAGIAVLLALYTGRSIAAPLQQLTDAATGFAAGRTDLPMPRGRVDEIGDLTKAFDEMINKRRQAEEALRRARDELEQRVTERTAELADANAVLHREVAERGLAEQAARHSEERFRQIAENIQEVFYMTSADWRDLLYVSPAYERIWGRTCASLYESPQHWFEAILPEDRANAIAGLEKHARGEPFEVEYRIAQPDGALRWIRSRGFPIRDERGTFCRVVGVAADITERKQGEAAFERVNQQLRDASRQAGMAEVATNVLHNVGNVLNSVNVSATLAADHIRQSSAPNLAEVVALLREHAHDLGDYITTDPTGRQLPGFLGQLSEQLAAEQKAVAGELEQLGKNVEHIKDIVAVQQSYACVVGISERVNVVDLVEDSLRMNAGALVRHDVRLVREFEAAPVISVDKHKIIQILVNLIRNAKYACDEAPTADKRMTVRIDNGENAVRIAVIDNGVGIPAENLTRIFSLGFTTREGGHGFGLHSGALAAREVGGALRVESDGPGRGATFTLELPLQPPQPGHDNA